MKKILIIEDDIDISTMLVSSLKADYQLDQAFSGREALFLLQEQTFDIILLDLMLPGMPGEAVITEIKAVSSVPIIVMSALADSEKIVELLEKGANDYITKPFDINVLKARIHTQLRISKDTTNHHDTLTYGDLTLCLKKHEAWYKGKDLTLSHKELQILDELMRNPQKIFSKSELYEKVWDDEYLYDENTMNVHISSLRRKIKTISNDFDPIETIWGIGIRIAKGENA